MRICVAQHLLSPVLQPLAAAYSYLMLKRRTRYTSAPEKGARPQCPCISVGNIAVGGTGKTPVTGWLLDWAKEKRLKAVVLSRGYGGSPGNQPLLVRPTTQASQCGDEPLLLARNNPEAFIFAYPKRWQSLTIAEQHIRPDIIVLDDGMQHLKIRRDLDLVLLRHEDLGEGWNKVLPQGLWREGESALSCASAYFIKCDADKFAKIAPLAQQKLAPYEKPLFSFSLHPIGLYELGKEACPQTFDGDYLLISAVGNPQQVEATVESFMHRPPYKHIIFRDHYAFTAKDLAQMDGYKLPIICTQKDAMKIEPLLSTLSHPIFMLKVKPVFGPSLFTNMTLNDWLDEQWRELAPSRADSL